METCVKAPNLLDWVEWRNEASYSSISQIQFVQERKNHSHALKLKNSEVIIIKAAEI